MYWCDGEDRDEDCESESDVCNRDFDDSKEEAKLYQLNWCCESILILFAVEEKRVKLKRKEI